MDNKTRVGIIGLGRSGWNIHAKTIETLPDRFAVTAVIDQLEERRQEARDTFGCHTFTELDEFLQCPDTDLVVVASPNHLHRDHVVAALQAGKHVVCEKPVGLNVAQVDDMIAAAEAANRILAPFQNRRYDADFVKVRKIIDSGILGTVLRIRSCWQNFNRRWDWQTLREFGGGTIYNAGPHALDQALQLFGSAEPEIFVDIRNINSSGDADDHVKLVLKGDGAPTIDIEMTAACAIPEPKWHIMGTNGGLTGTAGQLHWKYLDLQALKPAHEVDRAPTADRSYNREDYDWIEDSWEGSSSTVDISRRFYEDLHQTLTEDAPLVVTPAHIRRQIATIEHCVNSA